MIRFVSLSVLALAAPAMAQTAPKKPADPNKMICRSEPVIGSRLESTRRCMTAQQWTDLQRETRQTIERVQRTEYKQR